MGNIKDNINKIVSKENSNWLEEAKERQSQKGWRNRSFRIAVRILREIREQKAVSGMTQKKLAEMMGVSPQYINKILKGKENLTLETIDKIEEVLGITLIEVTTAKTSEMTLYSSSTTVTPVTPVSRTLAQIISKDRLTYQNEFIYAKGTDG